MSPQEYAKPELLEHVALAAGQAAVLRLPGLEGWQRGEIRRTALPIYDINGKVLFLDYTVAQGKMLIGTVRAAASKILGPPVVSLISGPRGWDYDLAVKKLAPRVEKGHPDWKLVDSKLVCYSYPKLGVMFTLVDKAGKSRRLIFDIASHGLIPEARAGKGKDVEGAVAWSFYDSLQAEEQNRRFQYQKQIDEARLRLPGATRRVLTEQVSIARIVDVVYELWHHETKQLQFCPHYDYDEPRSHHCFSLHTQQKDDYCALATCQMILDYYRYYYTQDQIATPLEYSDVDNGCPADQSPGYEQLTCNHLDATYDNSPTWQEARAQIDALHPLKSGVPHHARACAGYSYAWSAVAGAGITQKKLYIYDPWPWNADYKLGGGIYWEDWDAIEHKNYVFTRIRCPE